MKLQVRVICGLFYLLTCGASWGQTLQLFGNGLIIADGDATPRTADATLFPAARASTSAVSIFGLRNVSNSTPLTISSVSFTGTGAAAFTYDMAGNGTIAPAETTWLYVNVNGPVSSSKDASIVINSNDPGNPVYSFSLHAPVSSGVAGPFVELGPYDQPSATAIATQDPKTSFWTLKLRMQVSNYGNLPSEAGILRLYLSDGTPVGANAPMFASGVLKPIGPKKSDNPKVRKAKVTLKQLDINLGAATHILVQIDNPADPEAEYYNNHLVIPITFN